MKKLKDILTDEEFLEEFRETGIKAGNLILTIGDTQSYRPEFSTIHGVNLDDEFSTYVLQRIIKTIELPFEIKEIIIINHLPNEEKISIYRENENEVVQNNYKYVYFDTSDEFVFSPPEATEDFIVKEKILE